MRRGESVRSTYQVTLRGRFGPSFLAAFATMGAEHAATSSVFLVPAPTDRGVSDIARMLQARGLVLLGIRRVPARQVPTVLEPSQPGPDAPAQSRKELRCPSTQQPDRPPRHREREAPRPG